MDLLIGYESLYDLLYAFSVYIAILHSSQLSSISLFHLFYRVSTIGTFACAGILWVIRHKKMSLRNMLLILLTGGICCLSAYYSGRYLTIMMLVYLVLFGDRLNPEKLCRYYVAAALMGVGTVLFLRGTGVLYQEYRLRFDGTIRYYFGFHATTHLPNYLFHITLMYYFARRDITLWSSMFFLGANAFAYIYTDTKAPFFEIILLMGMLWIAKLIRSKYLTIVMGKLAQYSMPVLAAVFFYLSWNYTPTKRWFLLLNRFMSDRLRVSRKVYSRYGFHLFGTRTTWVTGRIVVNREAEYFSLDSAYANMAICYGIIFLILFVAAYVWVGKLYADHKDLFACCVLFILALHSFTDPQVSDYVFNPLMILMLEGYRYYRSKKKRKRRRGKKRLWL